MRTYQNWHKSSLSSGGDNCVEIGHADDGWTAVRDTKLGAGSPVLEFDPDEWAAFTAGVKHGEFDA